MAAPGSWADNESRRVAGVPACVIRLRFAGVFLSMRLVMNRPMPTGLLISGEHEGKWTVNLYPSDGQNKPLLHSLLQARIVKNRDDGCRLIAGLEWDEGYLRRWPQTWLCAPTQDAAVKELYAMTWWLNARYPGTLKFLDQ